MAALKPAQAIAFLRKPPSDINAVLFYGPDTGLVAERAQMLASTIAARENPTGEILRFDDSDLDDEPDRIATELDTIPMFSGRRIVRATAGRRITGAALKPLLTGSPFPGYLIVEAGNLKPDDQLRAAFEKSAAAAAIGCYPDSAADLETLVSDVLAPYKLRLTPDARDLLLSRLGADRAQSRSEVEKLALFCFGRTSVEAQDVDAIVGDAADLGLEKIPEAAALGDAHRAIMDLGRAVGAGENAQLIIAITERYFVKIDRVRSELDAGRSFDDAIRVLRPPLHFRQKDAFARQCRQWSRSGLTNALSRIFEAARNARRAPGLADMFAERLLLGLAMLAANQTKAAQSR